MGIGANVAFCPCVLSLRQIAFRTSRFQNRSTRSLPFLRVQSVHRLESYSLRAAPIYLDDHSLLDTDEVQDITIITMLPAKLAAIEFSETESVPWLSLRIGHALSEQTMQ